MNEISEYSDYVLGWAIVEMCLDSQQEQEYFSPPQCPERSWGPIDVLFKRYRRLFFEGRGGEGENL
jgi:hypothetical protein